jgi:hypothetical protein
VLARSQATGGGGREHTLDLIGLRRYAGKADTLVYISGPDDTQDVTRRGLVRLLRLALVRYLMDTPVANQMVIQVPTAAPGAAPVA